LLKKVFTNKTNKMITGFPIGQKIKDLLTIIFNTLDQEKKG